MSLKANGQAVLDFGEGATDTSIAVPLPSIASTDTVSATILAVATSDHSADEHMAEPLRVMAGDIVPGTGFTVRGLIDGGQATGAYRVAWTVHA